jgi:general secretion pathway protein G
MYRTRKSGFTLVEILIVVIILGILAAIVIPQFTNASQDARKSNLASQCQTLKSQIELYKLQHKDVAPDLITSWNPFLEYSDINGTLSATRDDAATPPVNLGPYMQAKPANPLLQLDNVKALGTVDGSAGWTYELSTGKIHGVAKDGAGAFHETDDGVYDINGTIITY